MTPNSTRFSEDMSSIRGMTRMTMVWMRMAEPSMSTTDIVCIQMENMTTSMTEMCIGIDFKDCTDFKSINSRLVVLSSFQFQISKSFLVFDISKIISEKVAMS